MLVDPYYYVEDELKFKELSKNEMLNKIRYAKGQITHYKKLNETDSEYFIDPSPDVYISWWGKVLDYMNVIYTIEYGKK